jgi:hypothetical protein
MKKLVVLMAVAMLMVFAVACFAQYYDEGTMAKQNAIKLGVFRPQDGDVREFVGKTWFMAAYERTIKTMPQGGDLTVELGYTQKNGDVDARVIPLTLNYRASMAPGGASIEEGSAKGETYYGAGLGAYFVRFSDDVDTESKTKFGANVFVGYGDKDWLLELKYHFVSKIEGVRPGGFALMAGYKF